MSFRTLAATCILTAAFSGVPPARLAAQAAPSAGIDQTAEATRQQLRELFDRYPPALGQVLRLDPSLLARQDYLATYPALAAYVAAHPEIAHNPAYFLGGAGAPEFGDRPNVMRAMDDMVTSLLVAAFFISALFVIAGIARSLLEHRRWLQAMKVQTEAHTKLLDRLGANQDLLAYLQSSVGQQFLTAAPMVFEAGPRTIAAPVGRIFWSVQTGVVLAFAGLGLWAARFQVVDEAAQPLAVIALLALSIGLGFILSAVISFLMSRRLGLIHSSAATNA